MRLGVLASGGGTNLQALLEACASRRIEAEVALVLSNVPGAGALDRAARAGVSSACLPSRGVTDRSAYDASVVARLREASVDLVCLAGYMRLVTPTFLRAFGPSAASRGCPRVVNVHPALLPSFPGLHGPRQALEAGVKVAGCTVHFVDEGTDTGPVIAQAAVPVLDGDTEDILAARILEQEHRIYPQAVQWIAEGRLSLEGRRVRLDRATPPSERLRSPSVELA
jgi:phosphoribosylglycinamide formyltransferase 1